MEQLAVDIIVGARQPCVATRKIKRAVILALASSLLTWRGALDKRSAEHHRGSKQTPSKR